MRYLTKDWYLKCQIYPQTQALRAELKAAVDACRAQSEREELPEDLRKRLALHDDHIIKMEVGTDCILEIEDADAQRRRIVFLNAVVKQECPPTGAIWLYEELYRHKSGKGYEAHILSYKAGKPKHKEVLKTDLFETKIICDDIVLE